MSSETIGAVAVVLLVGLTLTVALASVGAAFLVGCVCGAVMLAVVLDGWER